MKAIHLSLIAFCLFLTVNLSLQQGGFLLYGEADWFLIDHNNPDRSFISKVICPHKHDAEHYMARELAHLVEHFDARFIHKCVMMGHPHFLSLSNYLCVLAICLMTGIAIQRSGHNKWLYFFALLVLLFSPPVITSGNYIRSGHMLATAFMVALILYVFNNFHRWNWKVGVNTFILSLLTVWSDRQGLVAVLTIAAFCVWVRLKRGKVFCAVMAAAVALHTIHYLFIGPKLIAAFTPFKDVVTPGNIIAVSGAAATSEGFFGSLFRNWFENGIVGIQIAANHLRHLMGGVPGLFAAAFAGLMAGLAVVRKMITPVAVLFAFLATAGMHAIIYGAAKVLVWPDVSAIIYYNIIGTVAMWIPLVLLLYVYDSIWATDGGREKVRIYLNAAMCVVFLSSLLASFGHVKNFKQGHLQGFIAGAPFLRQALKETVNTPTRSNAEKYDANASAHYTDWKWVMKNPLEYGGKLTAVQFVESSQYLQFVRSERGLPFGKGGRWE